MRALAEAMVILRNLVHILFKWFKTLWDAMAFIDDMVFVQVNVEEKFKGAFGG